MSAGTTIVRLRELVREALPFLAHRSPCAGGSACSCGASAIYSRMRDAMQVDPGRTGGRSHRHSSRHVERRV